MKDLIERLKIVQAQLEEEQLVENATMETAAILIAAAAELSAITPALEQLDGEHTRQTDELRGLREEHEGIRLNVQQRRREWQIWEDDGVSCLEDDVAFLLTDIGRKMQVAEEDAAAMRGALEKIAARGIDPEVDTEEARARRLDHLAYLATGAMESATGAALRKDIRRLEQMVEKWEDSAREYGSGYYHDSDRKLATRVERLINHYQRTAANAISGATSFKSDMLTWLRAMAINAEAVSWGSTHAEKNARLRGLVEVIEAACKRVNEARVDSYRWGHEFDDWMKSDYPVRELLRELHQKDDEIRRLRSETNGQPPQEEMDEIES